MKNAIQGLPAAAALSWIFAFYVRLLLFLNDEIYRQRWWMMIIAGFCINLWPLMHFFQTIHPTSSMASLEPGLLKKNVCFTCLVKLFVAVPSCRFYAGDMAPRKCKQNPRGFGLVHHRHQLAFRFYAVSLGVNGAGRQSFEIKLWFWTAALVQCRCKLSTFFKDLFFQTLPFIHESWLAQFDIISHF